MIMVNRHNSYNTGVGHHCSKCGWAIDRCERYCVESLSENIQLTADSFLHVDCCTDCNS